MDIIINLSSYLTDEVVQFYRYLFTNCSGCRLIKETTRENKKYNEIEHIFYAHVTSALLAHIKMLTDSDMGGHIDVFDENDNIIETYC